MTKLEFGLIPIITNKYEFKQNILKEYNLRKKLPLPGYKKGFSEIYPTNTHNNFW
jgi:hypothetical protein